MYVNIGSDAGRSAKSSWAVALACAWSLAVGLLVLLGHALGVRPLATVLLGRVPVAAETGLAFALAGTGLWLVYPAGAGLRRRVGQGLGGAVALIGASVLLQYAFGSTGNLDRWLFADATRGWAEPGQPGPLPYTALVLTVVGLVIVLLDVDPRRAFPYARFLELLLILLAWIGLAGRTTRLDSMAGVRQLTGVALASAVTFSVLAAGVLFSRPDRPPVQIFLSRGQGGATVRRMGPVAFAVVALAIGLFAVPTTSELLDGFGVLAAATILLATLWGVLARTGTALDQAESGQQALIAALQEERNFTWAVLTSLRDGVIVVDRDAMVRQVSPRWCAITGFTSEQAVGRRPPYPWWPPGRIYDEAQMAARLLGDAEGDERESEIVRPDGTVVDVLVAVTPMRDSQGEVAMLVGAYQDITERRRAAAEQRRTAKELDHFFTISTDLLCIASRDGHFRRLNPAWERALGYSTEELMARPFVEFLHPDDVEFATAGLAALHERADASLTFENRYRRSDGTYRWLQWNARLQGGNFYAVARDTTAQRAAQADRSRLAAIVESTDDAIIGKTLDGTITSWNHAAERIYGYPAEEALGRSIKLIFAGDEQERERLSQDILRRVSRGESVTDHDSVRIRKDRTPVHISLTVSPIRDPGGAVVGVSSIARDITARVQADERFRRLVLAAPDAMVIVDAEGRILLANDQTERLFGYRASELVGEPVEMLIPARLRAGHPGHRHAYLAEPGLRQMGVGMELVAVRRDGTEVPVEISLAPLDTEQGMLVSAAIRDISVRRQIERDLATASNDALVAARAKTKFVAMVSHEIRTPMNGVIGLTALLLKTPLEPGQRRYAEAIRASGRALLSIINDILDFSKIESGRIVLAVAPFDLPELVQEAAQVAAESAREKGLEVVLHYPPRLPHTVSADAGRLRQILLNLLGNAVKFTERGEVALSVDVRTTAPDDAARLTFEVADTGLGIAPDDLARIFEPFSQLDDAMDRRFGGTGLGLTICRQLVDLMAGRLDVDSEPGRGSRFRVSVPLARQPDPAPQPSRPDALAGQRLLIVEDNATARTMMGEHATAWGLHAVAVADSATALAVLHEAADRGFPYQVVVLDYDLPDPGGRRLPAVVAADPGLSAPRLILLTSGDYDDDRHATDAGAYALIAKPVGPSPLLESLLSVLRPVAEAPQGQSDDAESPVTDRGLVLLAEDNNINRMVAIDTLAMLGYRVDVARDGLEAVELATSNTYRAVLMDCQMPKMDGYAATVELRHREGARRHTPIIAMTAGAMAEDRTRCLDSGMDDYLAKPIDPEELRAALDRWAAAE